MSRGIIACSLDDGDELIAARLTTGQDYVFIATRQGQGIRFAEGDVRPMGRPARGVRGINLAKDDQVVACIIAREKDLVLSISEFGYGKRTSIEAYRLQSRGGKGVINMKTTEKTGKVVAVISVTDESKLLVITERGRVIRIGSDGIRQTGRSAQGVRIIDTGDGDRVASVSLIENEHRSDVGE
jgi:DNA gyrase subunit A